MQASSPHTVIFDVDGTLVQSFEFDEVCYLEAVYEVLGVPMDDSWDDYPHVTDSGLLMELLRRLKKLDQFEAIQKQVKFLFINKVAAFLLENPLPQVLGAADFVNALRKHEDVRLAIATGGWLETAKMKLLSAGIDVRNIPIASSNDHYIRTAIMQTAITKLGGNLASTTTYFGDAEWDKKACAELAIGFVLVGNRTVHHTSVENYQNADKLIASILQ